MSGGGEVSHIPGLLNSDLCERITARQAEGNSLWSSLRDFAGHLQGWVFQDTHPYLPWASHTGLSVWTPKGLGEFDFNCVSKQKFLDHVQCFAFSRETQSITAQAVDRSQERECLAQPLLISNIFQLNVLLILPELRVGSSKSQGFTITSSCFHTKNIP